MSQRLKIQDQRQIRQFHWRKLIVKLPVPWLQVEIACNQIHSKGPQNARHRHLRSAGTWLKSLPRGAEWRILVASHAAKIVRTCSCILNKLLNMASVYHTLTWYTYIYGIRTIVYDSHKSLAFCHYVEIFHRWSDGRSCDRSWDAMQAKCWSLRASVLLTFPEIRSFGQGLGFTIRTTVPICWELNVRTQNVHSLSRWRDASRIHTNAGPL